jgi:redox-sensitive bicupin YhaK (pirin superfamily)
LIEIIPADTRGAADHGWLKAKHSFSFADYYDPERMGFGSIRVINEDRIEPSKGFGTHPHNDMEIVTYIIDGALEHEDSMGNGSVIRAGDVQRMTAGTGVRHSEFNHSENDVVHLLQIWILPQELSLQPGYEQQHFSREDKLNQWRLSASSDGREASVHVHQAVDLYASVLEGGSKLQHSFGSGRSGYLQIVSGTVTANGEQMSAGDGATIENLEELTVEAIDEAEAVLFDMG